jgi:hypothetical protein
MLLPNAERAIIAPAKLRDYLLNGFHPQNLGKARLFAALGYRQENWGQLAEDLRVQHLTRDATEGRPSAYGSTYEIVTLLHGPLGSATIKSVWMIDFGSDVPRFLTAHGD